MYARTPTGTRDSEAGNQEPGPSPGSALPDVSKQQRTQPPKLSPEPTVASVAVPPQNCDADNTDSWANVSDPYSGLVPAYGGIARTCVRLTQPGSDVTLQDDVVHGSGLQALLVAYASVFSPGDSANTARQRHRVHAYNTEATAPTQPDKDTECMHTTLRRQRQHSPTKAQSACIQH